MTTTAAVIRAAASPEHRIRQLESDLSRVRRARDKAYARNRVLEAVLIAVWRWSSGNHHFIEELVAILRKADSDVKVAEALEDLIAGI